MDGRLQSRLIAVPYGIRMELSQLRRVSITALKYRRIFVSYLRFCGLFCMFITMETNVVFTHFVKTLLVFKPNISVKAKILKTINDRFWVESVVL